MRGMNELIKVDAFIQALTEAKTIPEVKNLADQADLFRQWLKKQHVGRQAQNTGAEMCLRAQRKLGEMLENTEARQKPGEYQKLHEATFALKPSLSDLGIEKTASHRWQQLAKIPEEEFLEFLTSFYEAEQEITTAAFFRFHYKKIIQPLTEEIPLPEGVFSVIACDPPWQYGAPHNPESHRVGAKYREMNFEQLAALEIPAAEDCIFWLWTTNAFMHDAYHLLEVWEFKPKTILTWFKGKIGVGYWLRGETEHCILAVRGQPKIDNKAQSTHLKTQTTNHSVKPDEFYELVESLCGKATEKTHLEMFARKPRKGWRVWGNEIG